MASKYRRKLNQLNREREQVVSLPQSPGKDKAPLKGFEDSYQVNRQGYIWSNRLKRFIKHQFHPFYKTPYVSLTVKGVKTNIGIGESIADSFLSEADQKRIKDALPAGVRATRNAIYQDTLINSRELAKHYQVAVSAIHYILLQKACL